jgi:hypothetical protein
MPLRFTVRSDHLSSLLYLLLMIEGPNAHFRGAVMGKREDNVVLCARFEMQPFDSEALASASKVSIFNVSYMRKTDLVNLS